MQNAVQSCGKNNAGKVGLCNACFTGTYPLDLPAGPGGFEGFSSAGCEAVNK
jgi:hypothetical protein